MKQNQPVSYLPIAFDCRGRRCLVVGGGKLAVPKVRLLLRVGAGVTVAAPALCPDLEKQAGTGCITHIQSHFHPHLLTRDTALIVAAAEQPSENRQVAQIARKQNIPVNVVDQPQLCTFIFPAIVDRAPLCVAISTAGNSPVLARLVRTHLEAILPTRLGQLALFAGRLRGLVKTMLPSADSRRRFWETVLQGAIAERILKGDNQPPLNQINAALDGFKALPMAGDIAWISVAFGDPELLTLKALRVLQQADTVFYDGQVAQAVLNMMRRDAVAICIGDAQHSHAPSTTAQRMIQCAGGGERVCRISKHPPYAHRGNHKELTILLESGVRFQVIPSVSDDRRAAPLPRPPRYPQLTPPPPSQHPSIATVFKPGERHVPIRHL